MRNDAVLRSADYVAPHTAAGSIVAEVERAWQCQDGPPRAYVEWQTGEGMTAYRHRATYTAWSFGMPLLQSSYRERIPRLGHKSLAAIVDWFPDAVRQWVVLENELNKENVQFGASLGEQINPETHKLLWRERPMVEWDAKIEAWLFYARLCFVPKDAVLMETE